MLASYHSNGATILFSRFSVLFCYLGFLRLAVVGFGGIPVEVFASAPHVCYLPEDSLEH